MANQEYLSKEGLVSYDTQLKVVVDNKVKVAKDAADAAKTAADGAKQKAETNTTSIGSLSDLTTEAKTNVVGAINELVASVGNAEDAGKITVEEADTPSSGAVKSYVVKQNGTQVGLTIDIPTTDKVVSSGTVETDPTGQLKGTYIVLTLANAKKDKVYINVGTLVDIYKAKATASGDTIQVTVNSSTREISATIVNASITAGKLATNAVTTAKIADGNVTKAKLAKDVQTSLGNADSALQESDVSALRTDVADVKTSLAEGGATAKAIAAAKKAGDDAQAAIGKFTPISDEVIKAIVDGTYTA